MVLSIALCSLFPVCSPRKVPIMATTKSQKRTRFAIYTRYSSDMQNELSLEAQEQCCRHEIAERGGVVVAVYSDSARSGWSLRSRWIQPDAG